MAKSLKSMIQSVKWETERNAIAAALGKTGWNRKAAARLMGVSYRTMLYKIDQYHMSAPESYISPFSGVETGSDASQRETEKQVESRNEQNEHKSQEVSIATDSQHVMEDRAVRGLNVSSLIERAVGTSGVGNCCYRSNALVPRNPRKMQMLPWRPSHTTTLL